MTAAKRVTLENDTNPLDNMEVQATNCDRKRLHMTKHLHKTNKHLVFTLWMKLETKWPFFWYNFQNCHFFYTRTFWLYSLPAKFDNQKSNFRLIELQAFSDWDSQEEEIKNKNKIPPKHLSQQKFKNSLVHHNWFIAVKYWFIIIHRSSKIWLST